MDFYEVVIESLVQFGLWVWARVQDAAGTIQAEVDKAREAFGQVVEWAMTTLHSAIQSALQTAADAIASYVGAVEEAFLTLLEELSKFNSMGGDADVDRALRAASSLALSLLGLQGHVEIVAKALQWSIDFVDSLGNIISSSALVSLFLETTGLSGPDATGLLSSIGQGVGMGVGSLAGLLLTSLLGSSGPFGYIADSRLDIGLPAVTFTDVKNFSRASGLSSNAFISGFLDGLGSAFSEIDWWDVADYVITVVALSFSIFIMFSIVLGPELFTSAPLAFFFETAAFALTMLGALLGQLLMTLLSASLTIASGIVTLTLPSGPFEKVVSVIEMSLAGMILALKVDQNRIP